MELVINDLNADVGIMCSQQECPVGHSYKMTARVSGKIEAKEQVIIDFSVVKKMLKWLIDNPGVDHKLVTNSDFVVDDNTIANNSYRVMLPKDATVIVPSTTENNPDAYVKQAMQQVMDAFYAGEYDAEMLKEFGEKNLEQFKNCNVKIQPFCTETDRLPDELSPLEYTEKDWGYSFYIRYTHGLPNSTSKGCQNPAHGHFSIIQVMFVDPKEDTRTLIDVAMTNIAGKVTQRPIYMLNDSYEKSRGVYRWMTKDRGEVEIDINNNTSHEVVEISVDPTLENMMEHYIGPMVKEELEAVGLGGIAFDLYASEGLQKGCFIRYEAE